MNFVPKERSKKTIEKLLERQKMESKQEEAERRRNYVRVFNKE
jgi:hypothetical protein